MRQKPEISLSDFFEYLERVNDSEFFEIMGRKILNYDLTHSSVVCHRISVPQVFSCKFVVRPSTLLSNYPGKARL